MRDILRAGTGRHRQRKFGRARNIGAARSGKRESCAAGGDAAAGATQEAPMITLCIRYTIDPTKLADFAAYARGLAQPIERCGGKLVGYFLPTKFAGASNVALALIEFSNLATYEQYRQRLAEDRDHLDKFGQAERSGCILVEDRSFLQRA
jgi:NIPSNAP protein